MMLYEYGVLGKGTWNQGQGHHSPAGIMTQFSLLKLIILKTYNNHSSFLMSHGRFDLTRMVFNSQRECLHQLRSHFFMLDAC